MSGLTSNIATAARERRRRELRALDDPFYPVMSPTPEWDAMFGHLHDLEEGGYDVRADLGSLGRPGFSLADSPQMGSLNPFDAESQKYQAINAQSDAQAQRVRQEDEANRRQYEARQNDLINDQQTSYINQQLAQQNAPPIEPSLITKDTTGATPKYTVRPASTDPRTQFLNRLPPAMRAKVEQDMQAMDLKKQAAQLDADKLTETKRHNEATEHASNDDVKAAVEGMIAGTIPPQLPGRASKDYTAILGEAKRQGYDLATAATDWTAAQKHFATLNGAQQTRIRQATDTAYHSLDVIDQLADQWKGGRYPVLNAAALKMAKHGGLGKEAQSIATQLDAQITDLTSELGFVYMGGNSPTDHALELAGKNLSANWSNDVLKTMTQLARKNLEIRRNSIANVGVIGASPQNPYAPTQGAPPAGRGGGTQSDPLGIR